MANVKTAPTSVTVDSFLASVSDQRQSEARKLIEVMEDISGLQPVMWGPSIIGFGSQHYKYDTGREGDVPKLGFSPRKASITIYFNEGFGSYSDQLKKIGKHKVSVSCLYINNLADIDMKVLRQMLTQSLRTKNASAKKPNTVQEYVDSVPSVAKKQFDSLRGLVKNELPQAQEVVSYGVIGYKTDEKRAKVFVSGWKDHVAMYPVPKDDSLKAKLKPYTKGRGTIWLPLDQPLPKNLIKKITRLLAKN